MRDRKSKMGKSAKFGCNKARRMPSRIQTTTPQEQLRSEIFSIQTHKGRIDTIRAYEAERIRIMIDLGMTRKTDETE